MITTNVQSEDYTRIGHNGIGLNEGCEALPVCWTAFVLARVRCLVFLKVFFERGAWDIYFNNNEI